MQVITSLIQFTAQITNPVVQQQFGSGGANAAPLQLATLIATAWRILFTLAGLAVLIYMASGALSWITASGDKAKVEAARERITSAIIGIAIMFSIFALTAYVFPRIGFNLLRPQIPDNLNTP